jgi:Flp pilus assembly protein TadG
MSGLTVTQAQQQLDTWLKANLAVAQGQSYTIATENGSRTLTRANAQEILKQITFWDTQLKRLSRGGIRVRGACV